MALKLWLPLTHGLQNNGVSNIVATANGAVPVNTGKLGGCYNFDGSDDYIKLDGSDLYSIFTGET